MTLASVCQQNRVETQFDTISCQTVASDVCGRAFVVRSESFKKKVLPTEERGALMLVRTLIIISFKKEKVVTCVSNFCLNLFFSIFIHFCCQNCLGDVNIGLILVFNIVPATSAVLIFRYL